MAEEEADMDDLAALRHDRDRVTKGLGFNPPRLFRSLITALCLAFAPPALADDGQTTILAFGDSLVAGYGLGPDEAFVPVLEARLAAMGFSADVIDSGVSGDTTRGGLSRVDWALFDQPDIAIVELGGNDGLRGIEPASTRENLDAILTAFAEAGVPVLFSGMLAPPNMGEDYEAAFNPIFPELAEKHDVVFDPFFLEGVAGDPALNQSDMIHPNAAGVRLIVDRIAPMLAEMLRAQPTG